MSVPGIDYPTAVGIFAAIGEIDRFASARKLVSYFGLNPIVSQSAQRCWTGRISKQGRVHGRWLLVEAAHCAVRCPGPLRAFYRRIRGRKGTNVAVVAAARKLTVTLWHMLTEGEPYNRAVQVFPHSHQRGDGDVRGPRYGGLNNGLHGSLACAPIARLRKDADVPVRLTCRRRTGQTVPVRKWCRTRGLNLPGAR